MQTTFADPKLYINRELSWIEFNKRVLEEALDRTHPLLERLKFLTIFSGNLDEFFMIRVAGLKEQVAVGVVELMPDGMTPQEQLTEINRRLVPLIEEQTRCLTEDVLPALAEAGIVLHLYEQLGKEDKEFLKNLFNNEFFPVITPLAVDPGHPFPHLLSRSLNLGVIIDTPAAHRTSDGAEEHRDADDYQFAVIQLPTVLPRFIKLPHSDGEHFVLLEEIIAAHVAELFPGLDVADTFTFRVTRDADIEIAEDEASDLLTMMEEKVRSRRWGAAVRLELEQRAPGWVKEFMTDLLDLAPMDVYQVHGPRNIPDFIALWKLDFRQLKDKPFTPRIPDVLRTEDRSIFSVIRSGDVFLHHPFDSFSPVVDFLRASARDPNVLAIKQTLYRAGGGDSPVIKALIEAAEHGKQVTALVELKARFDEENNIVWARALERAGVHVVYGLVGLKTHCKICMVVRREESGLRTYVHLSTGNYNPLTAKVYTDFGLFTARSDFASDAVNLFNYLTGYSQLKEWKRFIVAPVDMRERLLELIRRETRLHSSAQPGRIIMKINSLSDEENIRALYEASQAGVKIDLLVRGICSLKPGVPGVSENIIVRSIVGRFLEHSRILYFANGGKEEIYAGSADIMPRNLNRRVELFFPLEDEQIKKRLKETLEIYLADNVKARELRSDETYERVHASGLPSHAQEMLLAGDQAPLPDPSQKITPLFGEQKAA